MDALHAYYESGGNKANAARRLSIHVNTLRQRLDRAHELLGGSIDDSIRAVPLRLALLVREVLPRR
jgi:DNA-binding PucR family transcriptional regulator